LQSTTNNLGVYWNVTTKSWQDLFASPLIVDAMNILLVPKNIVRSNYFYSTEKYIWDQILSRRQKHHLDNLTPLAQKKYKKDGSIYYVKPTKDTLYQVEVKGKPQKSFAENYTITNPEAIRKFRDDMAKKSISNDYSLSNFELDKIVYSIKSNVA
jgi:hypothetical protein